MAAEVSARSAATWRAAPSAVNALSGFHLAVQFGATRSETSAHEIDVDFRGKKQVRVLHRNSEHMYRLICALELGFERRELQDGNAFLQARFDSPETPVNGAQ